MTKRMLAALIALVGLFVALYLTLYKVGVIGELACSIGSCEAVQTSRWSTFLGLPVAAWGLVFYASVLAMALAGLTERYEDSRSLALGMLALTAWGTLFSLWLTYLELFVIRAICQWCVISALLAIGLTVVSYLDWRELRAWDLAEKT
jgi:uncharacterized membrane protein